MSHITKELAEIYAKGNYKRSYSEMTDEELKREFLGLYQGLYQSGSHSAKDYQLIDIVVAELNKRGYDVSEVNTRPKIIRRKR